MHRFALILCSVAALALTGCNRYNEDAELKENLRAGQTSLQLVQKHEFARVGNEYQLEDYVIRVDLRGVSPIFIDNFVEQMKNGGWQEQMTKGGYPPLSDASVRCAAKINDYYTITCSSDEIGTSVMYNMGYGPSAMNQLDVFLEVHRMDKAARLQKEAKKSSLDPGEQLLPGSKHFLQLLGLAS